MIFENENNALKNIYHQNSFVGTVHTHGTPHPQVGFLLVLVFLGAFSCYIHTCIYILFVSLSSVSWQMYRFSFFVNNVLGFAKKGNTKTLLSLP